MAKKATKKASKKAGKTDEKTSKSPRMLTNPEITEDKDFRELLPPLPSDVRKSLEESIRDEGLRDPLIGWRENGILLLVDGYNRYKFCKKHEKDYRVIVKSFNDREEVKEWMWENQESRRNMTPYQRIEVVLKFKGIIQERAKEQQRKGKRKSGGEGCEIVNNPKESKQKVSRAKVGQIRTNEVLGNRAGVSYATVGKVLEIQKRIAEGVISREDLHALRNGDVTINKIYNLYCKDKKARKPDHDMAERTKKLADSLKRQVGRLFPDTMDRNLIYRELSKHLSEWATSGEDDVSQQQK